MLRMRLAPALVAVWLAVGMGLLRHSRAHGPSVLVGYGIRSTRGRAIALLDPPDDLMANVRKPTRATTARARAGR